MSFQLKIRTWRGRRTCGQTAYEGGGCENGCRDLKRVARFVARLVQEHRERTRPNHDANLI